MPDFKGTISDLGGPSANMYRMQGKDPSLCTRCKRASCTFPSVCKNLNTDHSALLNIYKLARNQKNIKHVFIGSGIRYDLCLHDTGNPVVNQKNTEYLQNVIQYHVSGHFKVAPEHVSERVLQVMRKPSFSLFYQLKKQFDILNQKYGQQQQIVPILSLLTGLSTGGYGRISSYYTGSEFQIRTSTGFYTDTHDIGDYYILYRIPPLFAKKTTFPQNRY